MRRITPGIKARLVNTCFACLWVLLNAMPSFAQDRGEKYTIKDGRMLIELSKKISEAQLDSFITKFDLYDLDLKEFFKTNSPDSLQKMGWRLEKNTQEQLVISKLLRGFDRFDNPADKIIFAGKQPTTGELFPITSGDIKYGSNYFKKKFPFQVLDSMVTFYLRNNTNAQRVMLAGSFNDWNPEVLRMNKTDSGWIATVKLGPGKYWYKFIVDGNWTIDKDNATVENDGRGNDNSVYYKPNYTFHLQGFDNARRVYLSGSFNNWEPRQLAMVKTSSGWRLPVYLAEGTHTYRFVVDGRWMADPGNNDRLPNEFDEFNSVISFGKPHVFSLAGYTNAKQVLLVGSFNQWKQGELRMNKTATGWELPYKLGPGNYEYRYRVDDNWVTDTSGKIMQADKKQPANNQLVIGANYTFRLKGYATAGSIAVAGDFNGWSPGSFLMKRGTDGWLLDMYLSPGKHAYKFVVGGKWIRDPANQLWEQNEFGTGNSVIWFNP